MSKKTILKVIAVICVMSLCFAAVFTGAVSADTRSATCKVTGYSYSPGAVDVYVGYEVKFTSGTAFTAGSFKITPPADLRFVDCTAKASSETGYVPNVYLNVSKDKVLFAGFSETNTNDIRTFTSLTLVLKFTPTTAIKESAAGKTWNITIDNISITNTAEEPYNCADASGTAHVHNFTNPSTANGVTTKTCSVTGCGAVDKTIVAGGTTGLDNNNLVSAGSNKATLQFAADGDTVLCALVKKNNVDALGGANNTYFVYKYKDDAADYKFATTKNTGTVTLSGTDYYVFPCGRNGGIGRMSRNITGNFISGSTISDEWNYSIKSYLDSLITSGSGAEQNYAKALWNYGYYTTDRLAAKDGSFSDDLSAYSDGIKSVSGWPALTSSVKAPTYTGSGSWSIKGAKVETGYKPKMHLKLDTAGSATVSAYNAEGDLVYSKTVQAEAGTYFKISDIPTKYLVGTIKVKLGNDTKVATYSFGGYARARIDKSEADANVFRWMMNYAYYLSQAFA